MNMANDLKLALEKYPQLQKFFNDKELNSNSPLAIPNNPRMYIKYFGAKREDIPQNQDATMHQSMISNITKQNQTADNTSSFFLTSMKKTDDYSDDEYEDQEEVLTNKREGSKNSVRSLDSNNTYLQLRAMNEEVARKAPQSGSFGRVMHFSESNSVAPEEEEQTDFLVEEGDHNLSDIFVRAASAGKQSVVSNPKDLIEQIQVQMQLPALLVNQSYTDRMKRHKKYTEPLVSIRHEDLLEQLERQNPMNYKDLMEKDLIDYSSEFKRNAQKDMDKNHLKALLSESASTVELAQTLDDQMKVHNIDLSATKKVLLKREKLLQKFKQQEEKEQLDEMYNRAMEEERANRVKLDMLRKRHIASNLSNNTTDAPKVEFAPPDPVREMKRLALAERNILHHEQASNSHVYEI